MSVSRLGGREDDCCADLRRNRETLFVLVIMLCPPSGIPSEPFHAEIQRKNC